MLTTENTLSFAEAAKRLPSFNGKRVHTSTVWRWARRGCRGVKLETLCLGGRFVTSVEALERFGKALAEQDLPDRPDRPTSPPKVRTNRQRERSREQAEAVLREGGILV